LWTPHACHVSLSHHQLSSTLTLAKSLSHLLSPSYTKTSFRKFQLKAISKLQFHVHNCKYVIFIYFSFTDIKFIKLAVTYRHIGSTPLEKKPNKIFKMEKYTRENDQKSRTSSSSNHQMCNSCCCRDVLLHHLLILWCKVHGFYVKKDINNSKKITLFNINET